MHHSHDSELDCKARQSFFLKSKTGSKETESWRSPKRRHPERENKGLSKEEGARNSGLLRLNTGSILGTPPN